MAVRTMVPDSIVELRGIGAGITRGAVRILAAGTDARVEIFFMVAGLLRAGLDLRRALDTVIRTAESSNRSSQAVMLRSWQRALADARLADELSLWIPASEAVIFAGYGRGSIQPHVLFEAAGRIAEMKARLIAAVMKAMGMPALLALALVVMLWLAGAHVLPALVEISDDSRWGLLTVFFHEVTSWINRNEILMGALLVTVLAGLWLAVVAWSGWGRTAADRLPPFSIYRLITGWAFLAVQLEFLRVGLDLSDETFLRLEQTAPRYVRSRIALIRRQMNRGHPFGRAMRLAGTHFPDPRMIAVVEAMQGVPDWHLRMAEFLDRWIQRSERVLAAQLGTARSVLMVLVALVLAVTVNAMFDVLAQVR